MKKNLMLSLLMLCAMTICSNISFADCGCGKPDCNCPQQTQSPCETGKAAPCDPCEQKVDPCECNNDCECQKDDCECQNKKGFFKNFFSHFGF